MAISDSDIDWALQNGGGRAFQIEGLPLQWRQSPEGADRRDITQQDIDQLRVESQQADQQAAGIGNRVYGSDPRFQKLTPAENAEYMRSQNLWGMIPAGFQGITRAGQDLYWSNVPTAPQHNDTGGNPFSAEALLTGGLTNPYSEQGQTSWNDARYGGAIMALPFVGAGITAGLGAAGAGAGAAGAGAAEGGAAATGVDASTGLFAGESATSGAAGTGALSGGAGSASLVGGAGSDTAAATPTDETGAFDMYGSNSGAPGGQPGTVFDYSSPSTNYLQMAQDWAKQLGITPAAALQMLIKGIGRAAPAVLGAVASSQQQDQFQRLADQYSSYGAPYRERLASLYADPNSFLKSAEVTAPVQQASDIAAHSLSTGGNPIASGNSLQQLQDYSANQLFGRLGQEKDRLAGFGGLTAYNAAAPGAATNAINSGTNVANSIGAGISNVFNPPQTLAQQMAEFQRLSSGAVR